MKPGLKRIETTLDQLEVQNDSLPGIAEVSSNFSPANDRSWSKQQTAAKAQMKPKIQVEPFPLPKTQPEITPMVQGDNSPVAREHAEALLPILPSDNSVELASPPIQPTSPDLSSTLPATSLPGLNINRPAANPNLAVGLLKEFETLVRVWQKDLEHTVQQIQVVYQEGPIVDGWLESYPPGGQSAPPSASVSMLRHAEIEHLMEFIEQICKVEQAQITEDMRRTSYHLCGLDPDGKVWSRPCPSEQVPYVSLAIARYQKLRALLTRKQSLETRLTTLVESLTLLHGQINEV